MVAIFLLTVFAQAGSLPGIAIERRLAEALSAGVGDTVQVSSLVADGGPRPFLVEAVFERAADPSRIAENAYQARFHLPDLEAVLERPDRVDRFAVGLAPGASADSASRWIEGLAFGTQVYATAALAEETSATFRVVSRFHDAIGAVTLLASGIFLLCLMVIRVDERRADVRTLRLVGISRRTILRTVVLEAAAIAAAASLVGLGLGALLAAIVNAYYAAYYDTALRFAILTPRVLGWSLGLGLLLGVVGGALAALRVVGVSPQRLGER